MICSCNTLQSATLYKLQLLSQREMLPRCHEEKPPARGCAAARLRLPIAGGSALSVATVENDLYNFPRQRAGIVSQSLQHHCALKDKLLNSLFFQEHPLKNFALKDILTIDKGMTSNCPETKIF
jgi:hypothetical protein